MVGYSRLMQADEAGTLALFGGAGKVVAARNGSFLNIDNIHIYTGHA